METNPIELQPKCDTCIHLLHKVLYIKNENDEGVLVKEDICLVSPDPYSLINSLVVECSFFQPPEETVDDEMVLE